MTRFVVFCALALSACNGRQPARPEGTLAPVDRESAPRNGGTQQDGRKVLVAFGDSLTAGFGAEPGHSYPDYLQKLIASKGYRWRVVNLGISGETSTDGLARIGEVIAAKPDLVILELGANDGLRGIPVDRMRENLDQIIAALQSAGAKVVLAGMTLPPNYGRDYIAGFEATFRDLAAKHKIPLIPFLLLGVAGNSKLMQADGLHATAAGNEKVAANVMRAIDPLLKQ